MKLTLSHITKKFPNMNKKIKEDVTAVSDFSLEIPDGKLVSLLGPSGCGKSTTLNMISGLELPTEGKIFFGDEDVSLLEPGKRGIGLVFQNYALYPHMTVLQNISFPLENLKGDKKLSKEAIREKAVNAAKLVQIEGLLDRRPSELSGGQQQRVAIARALVRTPRVLLLDEPLSNLDARLRLQTREEIRRIQKATGVTTIFVTHDQDEAMSISDMIVVMKAGTLQQFGEPQSVYDNPANLFVAKFLGVPQINVFEAEIKDGRLYIGDDCLFTAAGAPDGPVYAAIRPEGFRIAGNGSFRCSIKYIEVLGRDTSIIFGHEGACADSSRAIVSADYAPAAGTDRVAFDIKPSKLYLFDRNTEERINCELTK